MKGQEREEQLGLSRRATRALGWSTIGTVASLISSTAAVIVISRLVEAATVGAMAAISSIATILFNLVVAALAQAAIQLYDTDPDILPKLRAATIVGLASMVPVVALMALMFVSSTGVGFHTIFLTVSSFILIKALSVPSQTVLQYELRFRELTVIQVTSALLGNAVVPIGLLVLSDLRLGALIVSFLAQPALELILLWSLSGVPPVSRSLQRPTELVKVGRVFSAVLAANSIATNSDNLIVGSVSGGTALGFYSRAYRLMALPANLLGDASDSVLHPVLRRARHDLAAIEVRLSSALFVLASVVLPMSAVCAALADPAVSVALGSGWSGSVPPFRVLAFGMFFRIAVKPLGAVLRAVGEQRRLARSTGVYAVLVVGGSVVGSHWGPTGVATAVVIALVSTLLILLEVTMSALNGSFARACLSLAKTAPAALVSFVVSRLTFDYLSSEASAVRLAASALLGLTCIGITYAHSSSRRQIRVLRSGGAG